MSRKQGMKKQIDKSVIFECLCRRSSDLKCCKDTGFPTQAFGDDDTFKVNATVMKFYIKYFHEASSAARQKSIKAAGLSILIPCA